MVCSAFRSAAETKSAGAFLATCSSDSSPKSRLRPRAALRAASVMTFRRAVCVDKAWFRSVGAAEVFAGLGRDQHALAGFHIGRDEDPHAVVGLGGLVG